MKKQINLVKIKKSLFFVITLLLALFSSLTFFFITKKNVQSLTTNLEIEKKISLRDNFIARGREEGGGPGGGGGGGNGNGGGGGGGNGSDGVGGGAYDRTPSTPPCRPTVRTCTVSNICGQTSIGTSRTGCGNSGVCSASAPALPLNLRNLDNIKIAAGQIIYVAPRGASPNICYKITKTSGNAIFIPLKTTSEFSSFFNTRGNTNEITIIKYGTN